MKIIRFIFIATIYIFLQSYSISNWYWPHKIYYGSSLTKWCDDDNDNIDDPVCAQLQNGPNLGGTNCPKWPLRISPEKEEMTCRYWDGQLPEILINEDKHLTRTNNLQLNITFKDTGWSKLNIIRYRWKIDNNRNSRITIASNQWTNNYSLQLDVPEWIVYLELYVEDGAQNKIDRVFGPYYIDKTKPSINELTIKVWNKLPWNWLLADTGFTVLFDYKPICNHLGCSPIKVFYELEDKNTATFGEEKNFYFVDTDVLPIFYVNNLSCIWDDFISEKYLSWNRCADIIWYQYWINKYGKDLKQCILNSHSDCSSYVRSIIFKEMEEAKNERFNNFGCSNDMSCLMTKLSCDDWYNYSASTNYCQLWNKDFANKFKTFTSELKKQTIWDLSEVKTSKDFNSDIWWRYYSIKISKICDDAGNCIDNNGKGWTYDWPVYANTPKGYEIIKHDLTDSKIGDNNDTFNIFLTLKDKYWNPFVPSPWINRQIMLKLSYNNEDVYLDQYHLKGIWIKYKFSLSNWLNTSMNSNEEFINYSQFNSAFKDGTYFIWFKSYVPTFDGNSKAYGRFLVEDIFYSSNDDLLGNIANKFTINQYLKFKPHLYADLIWIPPLAAEGVYKKFKVKIIENWAKNYNAATFFMKFNSKNEPVNTYLAYNSTDKNARWKSSIYGYMNSNLLFNDVNSINKIGKISSWNDIDKSTFFEKFQLLPHHKLKHESFGYLSTHFIVKYNDWTLAAWNTDVVWLTNYNYNPKKINYLYQVTLSIKWLVWVAKNYKTYIYNSLSGNTQLIWWLFPKYRLKKKVHEMVTTKFRWYLPVLWDKNAYLDIWNTQKYFRYKDIKVIYLKGKYWEKVVIPGKISYKDKVLLITQWLDVFLTGDIQMWKNGIFWIICLDNNYGFWGNIYVNTNITNLEAYLYADKALISYKGNPVNNTFFTQEKLSQDDLSNQLLIKWVLWSFNTLWASLNWKCPYFNKHCSYPKKYDLTYLRRFYLIKDSFIDPTWDDNSYIPYGLSWTKLIWGIKCKLHLSNGKKITICFDNNLRLENIITLSDKIFTKNWLKNNMRKIAPVIVQYNPKFKLMYLPIFSDLGGVK